MLLRDTKGVIAIHSPQDRITFSSQEFIYQVAYAFLVFYKQDGFGPFRRSR